MSEVYHGNHKNGINNHNNNCNELRFVRNLNIKEIDNFIEHKLIQPSLITESQQQHHHFSSTWSSPNEDERKLLREYRVNTLPKCSSFSRSSRSSCSPTVTTNSISTNTDDTIVTSNNIVALPATTTTIATITNTLATNNKIIASATRTTSPLTATSSTTTIVTTCSSMTSKVATNPKQDISPRCDAGTRPPFIESRIPKSRVSSDSTTENSCNTSKEEANDRLSFNDTNNNAKMRTDSTNITNQIKLSNNSKSTICKNSSHPNSTHHFTSNAKHKKSKLTNDVNSNAGDLPSMHESIFQFGYLKLDCNDSDHKPSDSQKDECTAPFIFKTVDYIKRLNVKKKALKKSKYKKDKVKTKTKR